MQERYISLRTLLSIPNGPLSESVKTTKFATGWSLQPMSVRFSHLDPNDTSIGYFEQLNASSKGLGQGKIVSNIYNEGKPTRQDTWLPYFSHAIPLLPALTEAFGPYLHLMCWVKGQVRHPICIVETHEGPEDPGAWSIRNLRISSQKIGGPDDTAYRPDPEGYIEACVRRNEKWLADNGITISTPRAKTPPMKEIKIEWREEEETSSGYYDAHWVISYPLKTTGGVVTAHLQVYPFEGKVGWDDAMRVVTARTLDALT